VALLGTGCGRLYVSPLAPPPHREEIEAKYDTAWTAIVRALAKENVPLRAIARDSGVIASDDFVAPKIDLGGFTYQFTVAFRF